MQTALIEGDGTPFTGFGKDQLPKNTQDPAATSSTQTTTTGNKVTLKEAEVGSAQMGAVGAIFAARTAPYSSPQPVECLDSSQPLFNYDLCTCSVQLPADYTQPEKKTRIETDAERRKKRSKQAKAAIWCGLDECGVKELLPPNERGVISKPIATWKSVPIRPGTCCYKNDQVIFQMPEKKEAINESAYYKVESGTGEPCLVQMAAMDDKPETDLSSDTFLMTISKVDDSGKQRRLQLAIKSPRELDETPCITTATTQYATEDVPPGWPDNDGGKKKKGGGDGKGKGDKNKKKK